MGGSGGAVRSVNLCADRQESNAKYEERRAKYEDSAFSRLFSYFALRSSYFVFLGIAVKPVARCQAAIFRRAAINDSKSATCCRATLRQSYCSTTCLAAAFMRGTTASSPN